MPLLFHPKAGTILVCDFKGNILPEMVKVRPVIIVSPNHLQRRGLYTVVPLSTTAPDPVQPYHYRFEKDPTPYCAPECWVKCDMIATVSAARLDRIKVSKRNYANAWVSDEELAAIRECIKWVVGIP